MPVTCADALAACDILDSCGGTAIRSVLAARGSPLAACDYHAVYRPGLPRARAGLAATGGVGPKGRHLARAAFAAAVRDSVREAACKALRAALDAFATDERYVTQIARDAVALKGRAIKAA